jgi:alpha-ketoglutarate-dependent taurine dioxygenase
MRINLDTVVETIRSLQVRDGFFTKKLALHGTILFRGLPIHSAQDFSTFAHAFGFKVHESIGVEVNRQVLAPNVTTANEAPKEIQIYNHNESPHVPHAPEYILFYSHRAPIKGGESPISSSLELFYRAQQEIPEFIAELAEKGILCKFTYFYKPANASSTSINQAFGSEIQDNDDDVSRRLKVEAQIMRYGRGKHTTWEWIQDGQGLVVTHRLPAIRTQPGTNLPTLFTGLTAFYRTYKYLESNNMAPKGTMQQFFGDGTPIPEKYLAHLAQITDEIRVLHKWQEGDVLVYDNIIAQHGREPWEGEQSDRVVLASLFDGPSVPGAYGFGDWAQLVQPLDK